MGSPSPPLIIDENETANETANESAAGDESPEDLRIEGGFLRAPPARVRIELCGETSAVRAGREVIWLISEDRLRAIDGLYFSPGPEYAFSSPIEGVETFSDGSVEVRTRDGARRFLRRPEFSVFRFVR